MRRGWWALSREKGLGEKKSAEGRKEEKHRKRMAKKMGGRKKARRRSKKRTMPLLHSRFEVENFLIENYESYLLCRGFGRRVVCRGGRGEERRRIKEEG